MFHWTGGSSKTFKKLPKKIEIPVSSAKPSNETKVLISSENIDVLTGRLPANDQNINNNNTSKNNQLSKSLD